MTKHRGPLRISVLLVSLSLASCAAVKEFAALRHVDFEIDHVSDMRLAGIDMNQIQSYEDLGLMQVAKLGLAVSGGELPLDFLLHLRAENPATNKVQARMVGMSWTLLLEDRETVSGALESSLTLPPGEPQDIPLTISLDLLEFFEGNARDLIDLALALAGAGGAPKNVSLRATPTVDTPIGPIKYPKPITIVSRELGR